MPDAKIVHHIMDHPKSIVGQRDPPLTKEATPIFCSNYIRKVLRGETFAQSIFADSPVAGKLVETEIERPIATFDFGDFGEEFFGGFVARLAPYRGVPAILRAAEDMLERLPHLQIHLFTPGVHGNYAQWLIPQRTSLLRHSQRENSWLAFALRFRAVSDQMA